MYGQGHGQGHGYPYAPPPPPPRSGPAALTVVLIVLGALTVLGGGACVVVGGLVYLGAKAEAEGPIADPAFPVGAATSTPDTPPDPSSPPTTEPAPLPGLLGMDDDDGDDGTLGGVTSNDGTSSGAVAAPKTAGAGWLCNATGSVRVCGFANVCSNQMVSGLGSGADRFTASQSAKLACEGMARAKGGSTVCSVTCRPR